MYTTEFKYDKNKSYFEVSLEIKNLINTDSYSKTDSYIRVFLRNVETNVTILKGQTEVVFDSLNPKFVTKIALENDLAEIQSVIFAIYDTEPHELDENKLPVLNEKRFIGKCEFYFVELIKTFNKKVSRIISNYNSNDPVGELICYCEELREVKESYEFKISYKDHSMSAASNILYCFDSDRYKMNMFKETKEAKDNNEVGEQEWVKEYEALSASDNIFDLYVSAQKLTNCSSSRKIKMEISRINNYEEETPLCSIQFTIDQLKDKKNKGTGMTFNIYKNKSEITHSICFEEFDIIYAKSYQDYITQGLNLSLLIGIDYTASNKSIRDPRSLHYVGESLDISDYNTYNSYMKCLYSVAKILIEYDTDKIVQMYGFGMSKEDHVCNCQAMFPSGQSGFFGFDELITGYVKFTSNPLLQLFGPTNFSPILRNFMNNINRSQIWNYYVILMITDGWITDYYETIDVIVKLSYYPVSIIIVGVGEGEFAKMQALDDDQGQLRDSKDYRPMRDCVQFVDFNKVDHEYEALRKEVMYEVPDQIMSYFKCKEITPEDLFTENPMSSNYAQTSVINLEARRSLDIEEESLKMYDNTFSVPDFNNKQQNRYESTNNTQNTMNTKDYEYSRVY